MQETTVEPMKPMKPMEPLEPLDVGPAWWPAELGQPATSGDANGVIYAVFPDEHRLVVRRGDQITVYDTGDHRIGGAAQDSGSDGPVFSTGSGTVTLIELKPV